MQNQKMEQFFLNMNLNINGLKKSKIKVDA